MGITEPHPVMTTHSAEVALGLDLGVPNLIASLVTLVVIIRFHHVIKTHSAHQFQPQFQLQWEWVTTDQAGWATTVQVALGLDLGVPIMIASLAMLVVKRGFHRVIQTHSAEVGHQHLFQPQFQPQFQLQWEWVTTDQTGWVTTVQTGWVTIIQAAWMVGWEWVTTEESKAVCSLSFDLYSNSLPCCVMCKNWLSYILIYVSLKDKKK